MVRLISILLLAVFVPVVLADDPVKSELDSARAKYAASLDAAKTKFVAALDAKLTEVATKGDLEKTKAIKMQKEMFEKDGTLPKSPVLTQSRSDYEADVRSAKEGLIKALEGAKVAYTKAIKVKEADEIAAELKQFAAAAPAKKSGGRTEEKGPLARALADYDEAKKKPRETMLKTFDDTIQRINTQRTDAAARAKQVDVLKIEKDRFEKHALLPWSQPMWPSVGIYLKNCAVAEAPLRKAFDTAIDQALRAKDNDEANRLRSTLAEALDVRVVATWHGARLGAPGGDMRLYSNGKIGNPEGKSTWSFANGGVITFRHADPTAPGGFWNDVCNISSDGATFSGKNQLGTNVGGWYVSKK
jgi:hypothetical protein